MNDGIGMTPVLQEPRKATKKSKKIYFLSMDPAIPHEHNESDRTGSGFVGNGTKSSPLIPVNSVVEFCNSVNGKLGIYGDDGSYYIMGFFEMLKTSDSIIVPHEIAVYSRNGAELITVPLIEMETTYHISLVDSQDGVISYLNPYLSTSQNHSDRYIAGLNGANPTGQSLYDFVVNDPQLAKQVDSSNVASVSRNPLLDLGETREVNGKDLPALTTPQGIDDFAGSGFTKDQYVRRVNTFPAT